MLITEKSISLRIENNVMAKKFVQKLYETLNLYIFVYKDCTNQILYDNECTENVHQIPTYIQKIYKLYKTCTKFRQKTA